MTANDSKMPVIHVFSYEPGTKVSKQKRTIEFPVPENDNRKLEKIRELLVQHKVLGALDVRNPFCDASGAEVSDKMSINVYLDQLVENVKDDVGANTQLDSEEDSKAATKEEDKAKTQPVAPAKPKERQIPRFYYKKKKVQTKTDDATQEFLKKKLDLKLRNTPALSPMRAQLLQSAFQSDKWAAAPAAKLSVVAELTERDWSVIARTNCLLSGQRLAFRNELKNPTVERTPFNAFKIKSRKFESYEIVAPAGPKKDVSDGDGIGELLAHIPRFRVDDSSYVTVIETQNSLQSSMAKSSFSQSSIEASAGGGFWGVSAAVKGGFSTKEGESKVSTNSEEQKQMHIVYSFPRVTVYLDAGSLELTDEVKRDIENVQKAINKKEKVKEFGDKYGHIFSRRVKLGGRLMSSHQSTKIAENKRADAENSLKAAAAVSISGWGFSASAESSHEEGRKSTTSEETQNFASSMSWEATGGNTVLCNNPPEWCGTVGNFRHWRIVEQSDIIPLTKLISTFSGFESIESEFHKIAGTDVLPEGRYVCDKVQLIDTATEKRLIALPRGQSNPLKTAVQRIYRKGSPFSRPEFQKPLQETMGNIEAGSVQFSDQEHASYWVLKRWVPEGQKAELSYGDKSFIYNQNMPEGSQYLCLTSRIPSTSAAGFLYPGGNENKAFFIIEKPTGEGYSSGPVRSGDTVFLRVWNSANTLEETFVMKSEFRGEDNNISRELNQVPAFTPRPRSRVDITKRIFRFRIVVEDSWDVPLA